MRTFTYAVDKADELLLALGRRPDDNQETLRLVLEPGLDMDAVDLEVDVAFGRQMALARARVASLSRPTVEAESPPAPFAAQVCGCTRCLAGGSLAGWK